MNTQTKDALVEAIQGIKHIQRTFLIETTRGANNRKGEYTWDMSIQEVDNGEATDTLFHLDKIAPMLNEAGRTFLVGKKLGSGKLQIIVV